MTNKLIKFYNLNIRAPQLEAEAEKIASEKYNLLKSVSQDNLTESQELGVFYESCDMTYKELALKQKAQELRARYE